MVRVWYNKKIAEYRGPLMTDAQVEAEPADGNQYMFAARAVGDLDTWVTVDGTPRKHGDNLAGYANCAHGGAANAAPSDEAHAPPRGHTGRTNIVIRATRKITRGTEIRMDLAWTTISGMPRRAVSRAADG